MFKLQRKKLENILFYSILSGVLILSLGIALIKMNGVVGTSLIILGSSFLYGGIVLFVFVVE